MRQLIEGYETSDREQRLDHIRKARWRTIQLRHCTPCLGPIMFMLKIPLQSISIPPLGLLAPYHHDHFLVLSIQKKLS